MIFKRLIFTLLTTLSLFSCVGQKEDSDISPEEKKEEEEKKKGTVFLRRILATEFTATWCVYCPDMKESIAKVSESHAGRIVEMAVHYADGMDCTPGDSLTDLFSVEMWPTAVFNMSPEWKTSSVSATVLTAMVDTILSHTSPVCGIKAKSILIDNNLSVTVSITSPEDGDFIFQAAVVENGIIAAQTGRGEDYRHDKVLRAIPVGKNLELKKGIEQSVSFEYRIPEEHTADNTDIIAYILTKSNSGEQIINNAVEFAAGSDIGYEYEKLSF